MESGRICSEVRGLYGSGAAGPTTLPDHLLVKRALRALQSPAYEKLRRKHPELPVITDRASLENTFKLLPMSMLALRVTKIEDPNAKKAKRVKGLWTVRIEPQQEAQDDMCEWP
jgi:translocation protein SEC62